MRSDNLIDSQAVLYSAGSNDECYTPAYGVAPIIKYIPKDKIIWCPFDTEDSEYVKQLIANGNEVIYSHISEGKNYYTYEPEQWDIMISNIWTHSSISTLGSQYHSLSLIA